MTFKHIEALKGCVDLQRQFDVFERELTWLHTPQKGWKKRLKRYFLSRWNSEPVMGAVVGVWMAMAFVVEPFSFHTASNLIGVLLGAMPFLTVLPLEKTRLTGAQARWSWKHGTCEPQVLEAMMAVFQQRFPELAQPFMEQLGRLQAKGLTPQQSAAIAHTLKERLRVSKDDAIAYLMTQRGSCVDVCVPAPSPQGQTNQAPVLRL